MLVTRRQMLRGGGAALCGALLPGGYAMGVEPFQLRIQTYRVSPDNWPAELSLKIVALADIHACRPWMDPGRIRQIVEQANRLEPDLIVLLGDYTSGHLLVTSSVPANEWAEALAGLKAPLGVFAVLGNHDWWEDEAAQLRGRGPTRSRLALERVGVPVLENAALRLEKQGEAFWLAGLGDQLAFLSGRGADDLHGALRTVTDAAPVILLAHEPDIFPRVPERVSLTLAGHTHGGQVRIFGYPPIVPSKCSRRFVYGHAAERSHPNAPWRHLIVSGGLGCSKAPVRFGVPPEIVVAHVHGKPKLMSGRDAKSLG
jgi:uncharacterized protein